MTDEMLDKCRELLKKHADKREAGGGGKREPEIQATTTAVTPSAYRREVAEAIVFKVLGCLPNSDWVPMVLAVLAEKRAVDPEVYKIVVDAWHAAERQLADLRKGDSDAT